MSKLDQLIDRFWGTETIDVDAAVAVVEEAGKIAGENERLREKNAQQREWLKELVWAAKTDDIVQGNPSHYIPLLFDRIQEHLRGDSE